MTIGYEGGKGGNIFQMIVCTPTWIARENQGKAAGRRDVIADRLQI
ncbi:Imm8 family immunity protein [Paraburkholderia sp. IW21]